ncbi:FxSxx-COOH system tetratricopeptide repeat protein [Actinoplanes sp. NPDC026623]|uniref:FxSxx-COOH system tetratricopeptide repeat protein n=1 Tax=Actinoplanes sp. NPDC026623 TaxID=3155610 RepID=UPI0033DEEF68
MTDGSLTRAPTSAAPARLPSGPWPVAILVVDDDPVMQFWSTEIAALESRLETEGGFVSVETCALVVGADNELAIAGRPEGPRALAAGPTGPRAVFLVTHGRSRSWRRGRIGGLLAEWARIGMAAVVNLLPQQRWHDQGLRVSEVLWSPAEPPIPTASTPWRLSGLDLRSAAERDRDAGKTAVPILEPGADWIRRWARLAGRTPEGAVSTPALLVPPEGDPEQSGLDVRAPALVARFRATASPQAVALAVRLAAAPLNARMIRALQRTVAHPDLVHLTEVLTSDLVRQVRQGTGSDDTRIVYDFVYGVRPALLSSAFRDRIIEVQHVVEGELAHDVEAARQLTLRIKDPRHAEYGRVTPAALPFLRVELAVHLALGGPNLDAARRLGRAIGEPVPPQKLQTSPRRASPGFHMESAMSEITSSKGSPSSASSGPLTSDLGHDAEGHMLATTERLRTAPRDATRLPAVVGNLPLRNPNFTGRSDLLEALHQRLRAGTTAVLPEAVHGAGGVGKSQLVIEYVYLHQQDFDLIWWIPAERPAQIQSSLAELAERLNLQVPSTANTAVPAVIEALRVGRPYSNWLLVFDNAENPDAVERFFPKGGPGSIVVTSRNPNWAGKASTLPVDVFERQESIELMRRRDTALTVKDADKLANVLGDLPLAIEAAAAWRAENRMTAADYLVRLEESQRELDEETSAAEVDYPAHVAAVWNISLNGLRDREPSALRLLQLCAFFAPEPIGKVLLSKPRGLEIDPNLDPLVRNAARRDQAIKTISKLALARFDHRTGSIQMHRLVQLVLINQMDPDTREAMRHNAHLFLAGNDPDQPGEPEHWTRYAELYPHIIASKAENSMDDLVRDMVSNEVEYLWRWGDHVEARNLAQRAYTVWLEQAEETDLKTLLLAFWLGYLNFVVGDYAAAARLNARTYELYQQVLGEGAEETLRAAGAVASDARVVGDFTSALERSQKVYEQTAESMGDDVPFTLRAAHNLAVSMRLSGLYGRALQLDQQTYVRWVQTYGTDHTESLNTNGGINLDRRELGDYVQAHADQENVVATARQMLKYEDHPDLLRQSHQLASFRRKAGRHVDALELSSDVLRRYRNRYGAEHPDSVLALLTVSIDQRVTGDLAAARESGEKAIENLTALYGDAHPHTAGAKSDLAVTLRLLGEHNRARTLDIEALEALTGRLAPSHALVLSARINLASDHFEMGAYEEARQLDAESFDVCEKTLGSGHPTTLACGVNLAMDLRGLGQVSEASALFERMMEGFRTSLGEGHPATKAAGAGVRANCDIDPLPL